MDIITSTTNETVKETVKLQQKKYRKDLFLLEGLKVIEEAILSGIEIDKIFINQNCDEYIKKFEKYHLISTTDAVLKKISTTESAPEIIAIAKQKKYDIKDLKNAQKVILLENIKDAGNLGTIIRTSIALNFEGVILYGTNFNYCTGL